MTAVEKTYVSMAINDLKDAEHILKRAKENMRNARHLKTPDLASKIVDIELIRETLEAELEEEE